jgi:hypothetical protein
MTEPDGDHFARGSAPRPLEPRRIPLWKLEEMAGGRTRPEGWRGNAAPLLSGWEAEQIHTSSAARDVMPGHARWPGRLFRALRRMLSLLVRAVGIVVAAVVILGGALYLHGDLKPSAFLGGPANAPGAGWSGPLPHFNVPNVAQNPVPPPVPGTAPADAAGTAPYAGTDHPTPGREEHAAPLGRPALVPARSTAYTFMNTGDDGQPVTYDPCRPIHYVTRAANQPAAGPELIQQAIAAVSRATGLVFINDGATTEAPSGQREPYQKALYGDRWAPVLIAWETAAEEPRFTNKQGKTNILGLGGSAAVSIGNSGISYVSGQMELNGPAMQSLIAGEGAAQARAIIEHELAHVVGLDHVQDPTQLMNPSGTLGVTTYAAGDLNGLAILGQGPCRPGI